MPTMAELLRSTGGTLDATGALLRGMVAQPVAGLAGGSRTVADLLRGKGLDASVAAGADTSRGIEDWASKPFTSAGDEAMQAMGQTVNRGIEAAQQIPGVQQADQAWDSYSQANPAAAAMLVGATEVLPGGKGKRAAEEAAHLARDGSKVAGHLQTTPLKPHPDVGTRYGREFVGDMVDKTPLRIEDLKGASIVPMPWDSTSRGYLINDVSGQTLPSPVLTTGGQDFVRDRAHVEQDIGGASNFAIAQRIQNRNKAASEENLRAGGSGRVIMLPTTMGAEAENFSSMPSKVLVQLLRNANLDRKDLKLLDEKVRNAPFTKPGVGITRPFGDFVGFGDPDVEQQLLVGLGRGAPAGELRKAVASQLSQKLPQEMLGYNVEDMVASLTDPALAGVGKGHMGNTVIEAIDGTPLSASTHPDYDTDFGGRYKGTLGFNSPIERVMPKAYASMLREMQGKQADPRNMAIGALERRGAGFSELVDQQTIDSVNQWLEESRLRP